MVRKLILVVALLGVVMWTVMCGRSRTAPASDTPVPTLTLLPTVVPTATEAATPTEAATEIPVVLAADAEPTASETREPTPQTVATEVIRGTESMTATESITGSEAVAESNAVTELNAIIESSVMTESTEVTEATQITQSETTTESPTETRVATNVATATPRPSATARASATLASTSTIEPTSSVTEPETVATAVIVTATVTASAEASEFVTETVAMTETVAISENAEMTSTSENSVVSRRAITLPTELSTRVQITDVLLLTDLIDDALPTVAELSPNGNQVAWLVAEQARRLATLCIANVSGGGQNCFTAEGYQGLPYRLVWSPDSQWLAFSEDPAAQALESDIWLFDVAQGKLSNRTDDGASGRYAEIEGNYFLDYLPMWDPATGDLYFWRSSPNEQGDLGLDLMRLDPTTEDESTVVRALGTSLGDGLIRFGWQRFYLQGPAAIAPDGSQVAVSIAPAQEMDLSSDDALWLIDLVNADVKPTQLATALAWQEALPQWSNQPAVARGLQWTEDGQGVVVAALSSDLRLPLLLAYYVDVESGAVTPVVDFSQNRERDAFFRLDPTTGHAPRFDVPWTVALAPDANVLLMVTDLGGGMRILGTPLPPTGVAPTVLHEHLSPGYEVWTRSSSADGVVLVYGMVVRLSPD